jgi:hypothetical protein
MPGHRRNMLELEKVLEKVISRLQEQGLVSPNVDIKELIENTVNNLKQTLGEENLPKGQELKDPLVLMKLTLSLIATHKNPTNAPRLINTIFILETPEQLRELAVEMQLDRMFLKFMQHQLAEKQEQLTEDDPNKNICMGLYDSCGNLIDRYEGVFSTSNLPGTKIQTVEELVSLAESDALQLKEGIDNDIGSLENTPKLTL